ncbi:RING-H2 zinc finger protein RHA4a-like [Tripterygium wilfordii]|uniref:RING-H2 zinc finger protein RHA4a-like n=2 Tax=Tripterygium wilfordii TaxID=458696 RepID=A0A7J7CLN3_TRIWF|nr:RING-H2 zinc finger protein RHA4a-like [Tripterygium wilfordii]
MALPPTPTPSHLYPQALQLKLYQAFIFSIPILFSIILFLLFYLFYLKRRASTLSSSPPPILPRSSNEGTPYVVSVGLKGELKNKLPSILCDEETRTRESQ